MFISYKKFAIYKFALKLSHNGIIINSGDLFKLLDLIEFEYLLTNGIL